MLFIKLYAYIFFAYGLTEIMVYGRGPFGICEKIRNWAAGVSDGMAQLFGCPMCFSTWVGLGASLLDVVLVRNAAFTPFSVIFACTGGFWIGLLTVLLDMFFTSGIVWLLTRIEEFMEKPQESYEADEYE
jgi:hypothetical protein